MPLVRFHLPDILHDFASEVIRAQPKSIYEFGAAYFAALDGEGSFQSAKFVAPPKKAKVQPDRIVTKVVQSPAQSTAPMESTAAASMTAPIDLDAELQQHSVDAVAQLDRTEKKS